ncbi:unnamed protein product [Gongylonema pulchrum]|uniref:BESS domain-containing protein n=1 Tax=Gongylonema pulchrum TaxID=637853 RepID=A0A183EF92_9BILA|nr:unnamed protein product [Gongylonema pulchrum]
MQQPLQKERDTEAHRETVARDEMEWREDRHQTETLQHTRLRVIYDTIASSLPKKSLNDNLFQEMVFLPDLVGNLLRIRLPKPAMIANLEKPLCR